MEIKTKRLILSPVKEDDWRDLKAIFDGLRPLPYAKYDKPHPTDDADIKARAARWEAFGQSILSLSNFINIESVHIYDIKDAILSCGKDLEDEAIFAHACEKGCDAIITSDRHFREQKAGKGPLMFTPEAFAARLCGKDYSP